MAVATIGGVFLTSFFGAFKPLIDRIDDANLRLPKAETRKQLPRKSPRCAACRHL